HAAAKCPRDRPRRGGGDVGRAWRVQRGRHLAIGRKSCLRIWWWRRMGGSRQARSDGPSASSVQIEAQNLAHRRMPALDIQRAVGFEPAKAFAM
ncbi:unnamed protein product, partial [Prorocentrum cordatum]